MVSKMEMALSNLRWSTVGRKLAEGIQKGEIRGGVIKGTYVSREEGIWRSEYVMSG